MQMRQEQQKQQYMMPQYGYVSPIHGQQFAPNAGPPPGSYHTYPYPAHIIQPPQQAQQPHQGRKLNEKLSFIVILVRVSI